MELKSSKILAIVAFLLFTISLLLPYGYFGIGGGEVITGIDLKLFVLIIIIIPLVIFPFLKINKIRTIIAFVIIALLTAAGFWLLYLYIGFAESYPLKLGVGIYLYFLMVILFFITIILRMKPRAEINSDSSIIDDTWN